MAKVLVTLEDNLLRRLDRNARARGMTRSAYLSQLAQRDLERQVGPGASPEARAALARLDELAARSPVGDDPTAAVRRERDRRARRS